MRISDWSSDVCSSDLNVTVRRVSAATSLGGQDRMANILFNIRRMKQEIGRAPDQRPVRVEILLHDQVMSCWRTASASISAKVMPVEVVASFARHAANQGERRTDDGPRRKTATDVLLATQPTARAVTGCSPLHL